MRKILWCSKSEDHIDVLQDEEFLTNYYEYFKQPSFVDTDQIILRKETKYLISLGSFPY